MNLNDPAIKAKRDEFKASAQTKRLALRNAPRLERLGKPAQAEPVVANTSTGPNKSATNVADVYKNYKKG